MSRVDQPAKVNPNQRKTRAMVCAEVISANVVVTVGGSNGHFELNFFKPVIACNLLQSARLLNNGTALVETGGALGLRAEERYREGVAPANMIGLEV